jgi:hypothetical protein
MYFKTGWEEEEAETQDQVEVTPNSVYSVQVKFTFNCFVDLAVFQSLFLHHRSPRTSGATASSPAWMR